MIPATAGSLWGFAGTAMASLMFCWSLYRQFVPQQVQLYVEKLVYKMMGWVSIRFDEYTDVGLERSKAYESIRHYLSANSTARSQRLKASESKNTKSLVLSVDDHEEIEDIFEGVKVKWNSSVSTIENQHNARSARTRRYFSLTFHMRHRGMIIERYMEHVLRVGKVIGLRNRERKLYTNNSPYDWSYYREEKWGTVTYNHPATFETLAMDPEKKEEIKKDLIRFSQGKDYYRKVGKPWKRGYLLFGPPGTGKSTLISAMSNFLEYDVYDLELTTVEDNSELKRLLLDTTGKCIIVIEDIDCSLPFMAQKRKTNEEEEKEETKEEKKKKEAKVTLSGLLNAIDGLWSASNGERIIVLTTNYVDKLDPALIRRGRMDKHIEMSYCKFKGFKVLAKNYLDIESHDLYGEIERLLEETDMSPADVAEDLMPKSDEEDADICLKRLVKSLEEEKENAIKKAQEEEKKKAEEEEKKKAKEEEKKKAEGEEKKKAEGEEKKKAKEEEKKKAEGEEKKKAEEEEKKKAKEEEKKKAEEETSKP